MFINPKISLQQNNIAKNKNKQVTLIFSDELIFYRLLDQKVESGYTVAVIFPKEEMTEEFGLYKRLCGCANGREFFDQMVDLAEIAFDAYKQFTARNILGLWRTRS